MSNKKAPVNYHLHPGKSKARHVGFREKIRSLERYDPGYKKTLSCFGLSTEILRSIRDKTSLLSWRGKRRCPKAIAHLEALDRLIYLTQEYGTEQLNWKRKQLEQQYSGII